MRVCLAALGVVVFGLATATSASANFVHVVAPGESLSSVAAADGLSVQSLAAANGLPPTAQLTAGTGLQIPPRGTAIISSAQPSLVGGQPGAGGDGDADADDLAVTASPVNSPAAYGGRVHG